MRQTSLNDGNRSRPLPAVTADQQADVPAEETTLAAPDARRAALFTRRTMLVAVALFLVALLFLLSLESRLGISVTGLSQEPYFNYQAESWLHGRWDVDVSITSPDIETINGKNY
ncbi:MAG TPA: hypothetical protein VH590_17045, partial [Ktedonobacterales bacterium]